MSESSSMTGGLRPRSVRILGAGKFGRLAARRLARSGTGADFLVVDDREDRLEMVRDETGLPVLRQDAVEFLSRTPLDDDVWIVPAVPVHAAFLWFLSELGREGNVTRLPVPEAVDAQVPNPYRVPSGTVYASFATFRCPDSCNEPDERCTHTRLPRPGNLFEVLAKVAVPEFESVVVRSLQLAPGVGGYTMGVLRETLKKIAEKPGGWIISTSCRCHGVIDCLSRTR